MKGGNGICNTLTTLSGEFNNYLTISAPVGKYSYVLKKSVLSNLFMKAFDSIQTRLFIGFLDQGEGKGAQSPPSITSKPFMIRQLKLNKVMFLPFPTSRHNLIYIMTFLTSLGRYIVALIGNIQILLRVTIKRKTLIN